MDVRLHTYHPTRVLLLLEYIPTSTSTSTPKSTLSQPPNVLLFIGGMYDNFRSPRYVDDIAKLFPRDVAGIGGVGDDVAQKWSVFHVQLSSAGRAFGIGGLDRDVSVSAIREPSFTPALITRSSFLLSTRPAKLTAIPPP